MTRPRHLPRLLILSCLPYLAFSFLVASPEKCPPPSGGSSGGAAAAAAATATTTTRANHGRILGTWLQAEKDQTVVQIDTFLAEDKVTSLFAWISRAFEGDARYGNVMLAVVAIFGNMKPDSTPVQLVQEARRYLPPEEKTVGDSFSLAEREQASLGAMGAAQWTGRWKTRPHALLNVRNLTHVDEWVQTLPRGCRRTIARALAQNFTVTAKPILPDQPAPHSTLAHFRCVVEHEVRLLTAGGDDAYGFLEALSEAVGRYVGTTRMTGEIREYRNATTGRVIAIAHEVGKGKTIRGQWFYATDVASKNYVWFHSVYDLVRRAIDDERADVVDLGPSGTDAFSELKERYGFESVDDWPAVANYQGDFWFGKDVEDQIPPSGRESFAARITKMLFDD
jgi:hypothetical protein